MADEERQFYAVQFHPEVTHTQFGGKLLDNFVRKICGCRGDWSMAHFKSEMVHKIKKQVGFERVICGLSGGVDSAVAAVLIHEAIGDQLVCVFVDTGLLRLHEGDQVMAIFAEHLGVKVIRVNAEQRFLAALAGVDRVFALGGAGAIAAMALGRSGNLAVYETPAATMDLMARADGATRAWMPAGDTIEVDEIASLLRELLST